jgi:hypothetical protein
LSASEGRLGGRGGLLLLALTGALAPALAAAQEGTPTTGPAPEEQTAPPPPEPRKNQPIVDLEIGVADRIFVYENTELVSQNGYIVSWNFSAAVRPVPSWQKIWLELGYTYGVTSASLHQVGTASLTLNVFELALLYRAAINHHLLWLASAGPTIALGNLSLGDGAGNTLASQLQAQPGVQGELGLEATYNDVTTSKYIWGVRFDVGFGWQANFNYNAVKAPPPTMSGYTPTQVPTNIGSISSAGVVGRLAVFLRF